MKRYIIILFFFTAPIIAENHIAKWKFSSPIKNFQERITLIKRGCKIAIHSLELLSGIANLVMCGCIIANDPRENPTFAEKCFVYTKTGIFGPILMIGGIMGLYEDITTPLEHPKTKPPQEHIVHVISHVATQRL